MAAAAVTRAISRAADPPLVGKGHVSQSKGPEYVDNAGRGAVTEEWRWEASGSGSQAEGARPSAGERREITQQKADDGFGGKGSRGNCPQNTEKASSPKEEEETHLKADH